MTRTTRAFLAMLVLLAAVPSWANDRLPASVGMALGGSQKPGYRHHHTPRFRRPFKASRRMGPGPAVTLRVPSTNQAVANVGYLDATHYQNIRDSALGLLRTYAPDQHYFIAVGRSPVGIATFLRELDDDMAMTFPASDMRRNIAAAWRAAYFEHFQRLIPADVLTGPRTIVLVDRAREGRTLTRLKGYLQQYLTSIGSTTQVVAVGLAPQVPPTQGLEWVDSRPFPNLFKYVTGQFDHDEGVAPYAGKHRIGENTLDQLAENPNYRVFRTAMRSRMEADAGLDEVLRGEFAKFLPP